LGKRTDLGTLWTKVQNECLKGIQMRVSVIFCPKHCSLFKSVETKSTEILGFKKLIFYQVYVTATGNLNPRRQKHHHLKKRN